MKSILNMALVLGGLMLASLTTNVAYSFKLATNNDHNVSLVDLAAADDDQADSSDAETMLA